MISNNANENKINDDRENDLKDIMSEKFSKIGRQSMLLGAQSICKIIFRYGTQR